MSTSGREPDWERLAHFVRMQRKQQGLTQRAVTDRGGPSDTTIGQIEAGQWRPGRGVDRTLDKLDTGMRWQPGSSSHTLAGGAPAEDGQGPSQPLDLSQVPADELAAELLRRIPPGPQRPRWRDNLSAPPL